VRENRTPGSVRGLSGNWQFYRDAARTANDWETILKKQFSETLDFLNDWTKDNKLIETALESCGEALKNCVQEEEELGIVPLNGYSIDEIQLHFEKASLVYKHGILDYPFIDTQIGLYVDAPAGIYFRDIDRIGYYRLITMLNGEVDDDYLVIDETKSDVQVLPIAFEMMPFENAEIREHFLDRFIQEAIENNSLQFGGGGTDNTWSGLAEPAIPLAISEEQVHEVESWMQNQPEIHRFRVGPIMQDSEVVREQRQDASFPKLES
jgi:uncharacterized protein YggL (DUF469 family)